MPDVRGKLVKWGGACLLLAAGGVTVLAISSWNGQEPRRRLALARAALARDDVFEAETQAALLERGGRSEHAELIRGECRLVEARQTLARAATLDAGLLACQLSRAAAAGAPSATHVLWERILLLDDPLASPALLVLYPMVRERMRLQEQACAQLYHAATAFRGVTDPELQLDANLGCAEAWVRLRDQARVIPTREAVERLRAVVDHRPDHADARRWLATLYLALNAVEGAAAELEAVARLDPADGRPLRALGPLLVSGRKFGKAMEAYHEALQRNLDPSARREALEEYAELLLEQGHVAEAEALLERHADMVATSARLLTVRAGCERQRGRVAAAREAVREALAHDPDWPPAVRLRARIHVDEQQPADAARLLERRLKLDPHDHAAREAYVEVLELLGRTSELAEQRLLRVQTHQLRNEVTRLGGQAALKPWDDQLRLRLGELCLQLGDREDARNWLRAALTANPANEEARQALERLEGKRAR